jgi:hypothetical protein
VHEIQRTISMGAQMAAEREKYAGRQR